MPMPPKYQVLADELRIHIQAGKYVNRQALPTEYNIAEEYRVSRQTVRQALSLLSKEGLIEKRRGSGSYIRRPAPRDEAVSASRTIAVITTYISDYIFPSILREVETVLSRNNCTPSLFATQNQVANERRILTHLLQGPPPDGILVEGTKTALPNPNLDLYRQLLNKEIPLVFMNGNYPNLPGALSVLDDNFNGGRMLVEYLYKKGHHTIAGIFKSDDIQGLQRYEGYTAALRDLSLPLDDHRVFWYNTDRKEYLLGGGSMDEIVQALQGSTAVVCYNDEIANRLISDLIKREFKIPKDMAVVSFDNSRYSDLSPVPITSLSHMENNVGRLASELLVKQLRGEIGASQKAPWVLMEKESG